MHIYKQICMRIYANRHTYICKRDNLKIHGFGEKWSITCLMNNMLSLVSKTQIFQVTLEITLSKLHVAYDQ